ncbi:hypothetical protein [Streptomyces sp. NPDC014791]|uniref:hypothetical protein n=1 Tax=Streptomyces sp. NPDC014791 TaxID=3364912 RepID=UPI0036F58E52
MSFVLAGQEVKVLHTSPGAPGRDDPQRLLCVEGGTGEPTFGVTAKTPKALIFDWANGGGSDGRLEMPVRNLGRIS